MSIFKQINNEMAQKGAVYVGDTHAYNIHNFKNKGKNSKLNAYFDALPPLANGLEYVAIVGAIGRSAHDKTALHVYSVASDKYLHDIGRNYFYQNKGDK